ncbi:MAG: substrate-binding domain-containing protein [Eubacteriales bacterium]|nr:substrate-binding domain-containing protein [Eubacteriales bacterium]
MKMKKVMALGVAAAMIGTTLSATAAMAAGDTKDVAGSHVFMFKSVGNAFGVIMYDGFSSYMEQVGENCIEKSPAETTVPAQVQLLDESITQGCKSISISTNGDTGFDEVFQKAKDAGIPIVSVDSAASADYRVTHNNQASSADIGAMQVRAAVMITLGVSFDPEDADMSKSVEAALADYDGEEINIGVLSAGIDTPVQNGWIAEMEKELSKDIYAGKVNPELDKKYGDDEATKSTTQAQAFLAENKVDVIISPTTVGIAAAGEVLTQAQSDIKLTGLGLPSEMKNYMPATADDDEFSFVCPYMMLWDVKHLGASTAAIQMAVANDGFDGAAGSELTMEAWGDYEETTFTAEEDGDGTSVLTGIPYVFYKDNMTEWADTL